MNSDLVSLIAGNENKIVKLQRVVGGDVPVTTNLDIAGYRILNIAQPRDPSKKKDLESDLLTAKTFYDYMAKVDQDYMRRNRDGSLDGRLNMSNHRINGLLILPMLIMPLQGDMLHRGFKHSVMKFKITKVSWMPFKAYLGLKITRYY